jgi:disulfide bond formation protein DsbB
MAVAMAASRRWLFAMAALCVAAVGAALVSQYVYDMQPCPWCVLQRVIFVAVALVCLVAALWNAPAARRTLAGGALVLAAAGAAAALWQHFVAAKSTSCKLTLADRIVTALHVDTMAPWLFEVRATCADAAVSVMGLPYEVWSLLLFVLLGAAALRVLARPA